MDTLFSPKSVAVIGASSNPNKWGNWMAEQLIPDEHLRKLYFVNVRKEIIYGKQSLASISEIPEPLDVAIVTVPLVSFETTIDELLAHGTKTIVAITTGFGERDVEGLELEKRVVQKIKDVGSILIGPNCAGILDNYSQFRCLPILSLKKLKPGNIGLISQSGGVIVDLQRRLNEVNLNFSRVISVGNLSGVSLEELIKNFDKDPNTKIIAMYIENDDVIPYSTIEQAQKPIVLMMPHHTETSMRAAQKHTNSKLKGAALEYVDSMRDFIAVIQAVGSDQRGRGEKIAIVTDSGGLGIVAAAEAEHKFLTIDEPSDRLQRSLRIELRILPQAVLSNPLDLIGVSNGFSVPTIRAMRVLQHSPEVNALVFILVVTEENQLDEYPIGLELARSARAGGKPVVFVCQDFNSCGVQALLEEHMPVYRDIDTAVNMVEFLCDNST